MLAPGLPGRHRPGDRRPRPGGLDRRLGRARRTGVPRRDRPGAAGFSTCSTTWRTESAANRRTPGSTRTSCRSRASTRGPVPTRCRCGCRDPSTTGCWPMTPTCRARRGCGSARSPSPPATPWAWAHATPDAVQTGISRDRERQLLEEWRSRGRLGQVRHFAGAEARAGPGPWWVSHRGRARPARPRELSPVGGCGLSLAGCPSESEVGRVVGLPRTSRREAGPPPARSQSVFGTLEPGGGWPCVADSGQSGDRPRSREATAARAGTADDPDPRPARSCW